MRRVVSLVVSALSALSALSAVAAPVPKAAKPQLVVVLPHADTGKTQLVLVDADGGNAKELTDAKSNAAYPAWSPDGTKIAFTSDRGKGGWQVFVAEADGGRPTKVTDFGGVSAYPAWSPDGKRLAFVQFKGEGERGEVAVADADGKNPRAILKGVTLIDGGRPAWRPR